MIKHKAWLKPALGLGLLVIILGLFADYIHGHHAVIQTLKHLNPWLLILLIGCYGVLLVAWMGVYNTTLRLCGKPLPAKENLLVTIYSTLANFFLPLQSGPGVRAAYLKKRENVPVPNYILSTLIYYGIYAVISAGFLFIGSSFWWLALPAVVAAAAVSFAVIHLARTKLLKKHGAIKLNLSRENLLRLFIMTLFQLSLQAVIYGIELSSLHIATSARDVVSYAGAANFSLFVALTPGAIGFREAFLAFSRKLHHFTTTAILSANLIDRGVFLVFLGLMFILMLATHAKNRLKI